ncbi:MAG: SH3 domain-containing protein [Chloroflexi bacterium]|nr:SH3 domain-containing protein [Chloroflexota bacterium]
MQSSISFCARTFRVPAPPRLREPGWRGLVLAGALAVTGGVVTLAGVARPSNADAPPAPEPRLVSEATPLRRVPLDPVVVELLPTPDGGLPGEAPSVPAAGSPVTSPVRRVLEADVELRVAPAVDAAPLAYLATGTAVEMLGEERDGWLAVRAGEQAGWVPGEAVQPAAESTS